MKELGEQERFLKLEDEEVCGGKNPPPVEEVSELREHRRKQGELLQRLKDTYTYGNPE
jgi:hypothetical protein